MKGLDLRVLVVAAFVTAVGVVACGGSSNTTNPSTSPSSLIPTPTPKPTGTPTPLPSGVTPTPLAAAIQYSGSTIYSPFTINVHVNGNAQITLPTTYTPMPAIVPAATTKKFFADLNAYGPVNNLKIGTCPKPTNTSYDDSTIVSYQNQSSGDISCSGSTATTTIYDDVKAVEISVGITPPT
jgi:hypothetical protein